MGACTVGAFIVMEALYKQLREHRDEAFCAAFFKRAGSDPNAVRVQVDEELYGTMHVPMTERVVIPEGPYTCPKCGSRRVVVKNEQTRSADEGQTTFHGCENGHTWRN